MENQIQIQLPVTISYAALEGVLREKMVGGYIPPAPENGGNEEAYAQIQDISLSPGTAGVSDILLKICIRILRTLLKRDNVLLHVPASLGYDNVSQQLFVRNFRVDARTSSGLFNAGLELLANTVAYDQILKKARVPVGEIIAREKEKIGAKLAAGMEPVQGIRVSGTLEDVRLQDIHPHAEGVSLRLVVGANVEARVMDLSGLLATKEA